MQINVKCNSNVIYPTPLKTGSYFYEATVQNKDGSYDGDGVLLQYGELTVAANYVLTTQSSAGSRYYPRRAPNLLPSPWSTRGVGCRTVPIFCWFFMFFDAFYRFVDDFS